MNWYYEKEGVSQGPVAEAELAERVFHRELKGDSLIWNSELDSWTSVAELRPNWLETLAAQEEVPEPRPATAPLRPITVPLREAPVKGAAPAPSRLKPQAPVGGEEEKAGFLRRLFGGGKKKT